MNNVVPMPPVGTRDGNWVWTGTNWVCDPDCDGPQPFPPGGNFRPQPPWFPPPATTPPWYPGGNAGVSFSPPGTPPPNPIRGNFWWDGAAFWLFDGAGWVAIGGTQAISGGAGASVGSTPPQSPQLGALWFDGNALLVWDGVKWDVAGGGTATGTTAPTNPQLGQMWFNGSVLYVWDGNAWIPSSQTKSYIQPTAPPAPNPGDTWWNGTQFYIWTGTAWQVVGPGSTVGPVPTTSQVFSVATLNGGTIATGTWEIMPINGTPTINTQGLGTWNINTHQYTPNVAGVYAFEILGWNSYAGYAGCLLVKNDTGAPLTQTANITLAISEINNAGWASANGFGVMNGTTDFVRMWWFSNGGVYDQSYGFPSLRAFLMP